MNITTYTPQNLTFGKFTFESMDDVFEVMNLCQEPVQDNFYEIEQHYSPKQRVDLFSVDDVQLEVLNPNLKLENQSFKEGQEEYFEFFQGSLFDDDFSLFNDQASKVDQNQINTKNLEAELNHISNEFEQDKDDIFKFSEEKLISKCDDNSSKCLSKKNSSTSCNSNPNIAVLEQIKEIQNNEVAHDQKDVSSVKVLKNKSNKKIQLRTKLAAVTKYSDESDIDLSKRRDVINKTILRILRRYFTQLFKDSFDEQFKSKVAKSEWYFECIKQFCAKLFGKNHEMIEEINFYMASIILPKNVMKKDMAEGSISQDQFDSFHNCLYKYSHTKLVNLLEIKPLGVIYEKFYKGPLDVLLQTEPSVSKNYQFYMVVFKEFFEIFSGAADVSTLVLN